MATLSRSLHRLRVHRPERTAAVVAVAAAALYLMFHQELLWQLNLMFGT